MSKRRLQSTNPFLHQSSSSEFKNLLLNHELQDHVSSLDSPDNDHYALIYEDQAEQFTTVIPYIKQGLEQGERCMYIAAENSRDRILAALRDGGVDVTAALESGQLSIHSIEETYLKGSEFGIDEAYALLETSMEEALDEYEGFRVTAEETWLIDNDAARDAFMACESYVNHLFEDEKVMALCQYNRTKLPEAVIEDVIETHPYVIYNDTVCENVYYTPPDDYFEPDSLADNNTHKLETLVDRTEVRTTFRTQTWFQQQLYDIVSRPDRSFDEKLQTVFDLGCDLFDMELGAMARVDPETDQFEIERTSGDHEYFEPGLELDLSETYCTAATDEGGTVSVSHPDREGYGNITVRQEFGLEAYLGTYLTLSGDTNRTFFFVASESRDRAITEAEQACHHLMGQWVQYELERQQRERFLRELYETTADPQLSFETKLEQLLDLGRKRFDLELAGLNHLPSWGGAFELKMSVGFEEPFPDDSVSSDPDDGGFCHQTVTSDVPIGMPDVRGTEWADDPMHSECGLTSYLGTKIMNGSLPYGTLWFGSTEPRDHAFSDAERTYIELMGQWVSYEIERRDHKRSQRKLSAITADPELATDTKLRRLLEVGCERLNLSVGMVNRTYGDVLEIEQMQGTHPDITEGACTPESSEHYCQQVVDTGEAVIVTDAGAVGWDDDPLYDEAGLQTYAGIPVTVGCNTYGTLCFMDTSPRQAAFTETERAFLDLMGQCVGYELERTKRETRLYWLSTLGQQLLNTGTETEVAESVISTVEDVFDIPVTAAIGLYNDETGELYPAAYTDAAAELVETTSVFDTAEGIGWDAFVGEEIQQMSNPLGDRDTVAQPTMSEVIAAPLGTHGVFLIGSSMPEGFERNAREVIETVAASVRAALDRATHERELQSREETLEDQNETLERLNRINDTIRSIDQALVEASTRAEIEQVVCEQLAAVGPYELAWIGEHDCATGAVTPREWAGANKGYLDTITVAADDSPEGCGPFGRAVKTGDPEIVNNILTDESFTPWRQEALTRGYHATAALPLSYRDTSYGVLIIYAGQPDVFDALEQEVLVELSDTVAHAINAIESKKALISDEITELEFTVEDPGLEIVELVQQLECEFSLKQLVSQPDGSIRAFFSIEGAPTADVLAFESRLAVSDLRLVSEPDDDAPSLFEATLSEESLSTTVLDHGGRLQAIDVSNGTATVIVQLAADAAIREFVEMFQSRYPESKVEAQRTKQLPQRSTLEFTTVLTEDLTDRQLETLQTAYYSGYFEEPRRRTGTEIADTMSVSQPTFNSHVRAATRKLCRYLFEQEMPIV